MYIPVYHFSTAPVSALVAMAAYLAKQPVLIGGSGGFQAFPRLASSRADNLTLILLAGVSISMRGWGEPVFRLLDFLRIDQACSGVDGQYLGGLTVEVVDDAVVADSRLAVFYGQMQVHVT